MLDTKTIREFIDELGSNSPAPGGGSVAALCASLGSALSSMVFNLTVGKKVYEALSAEEKELVDKYLVVSSSQKDEFLDLMNEDTEAFNGVMAAFKMPKETDEEKANRSAKIQDGYKAATQVPLKVARKAYEVYEGILVCVKYGNKNAISDGGVAALLIQSAVEGAIMNVKINLSSIKDEAYNEEIRKELKSLSENGMKKQQEILAIVNSYM
ncbi:MAG: cyclodeaminase/cyclohydrolase family protein [Clostridium sp.]|uniref:cyclodeaminase/cyclohydrolase family protein n=1 Tax=Clostridium sp. TaxID=1506 RepID=UPI0030315D45